MPGHYGLFDSLKEGVLGVFGGPQDPRVAQGTGQREALISAGLATLQGDPQDPLAAIAGGAQIGRQVGQEVQARQLALQQQAALGQFINVAGFDREGLTSVFMRTLASGDLEGAKAVSEILKSLPKDEVASPVNRQRVQTIASVAAGAPADVIQRVGEGASIQVQQDPRSGQIFWDTALPVQPPSDPYAESFVEPNEASPTGAYRIGIRRDTGQREIIGLAQPPGSASGGGGQEARREARIMETIDAVAGQAYANPDESSSILAGTLAQGAGKPGFIGTASRLLLQVVDPEGGAVESATAAQQLTGQLVALISGATASDRERSFITGAYTIQPGDSPQAITVKWAGVQAIAQAKEEGLIVDSEDPEVLAQNARVFNMIEQRTVGRLNGGAPPAAGGGAGSMFGDLIPPAGTMPGGINR